MNTYMASNQPKNKPHALIISIRNTNLCLHFPRLKLKMVNKKKVTPANFWNVFNYPHMLVKTIVF